MYTLLKIILLLLLSGCSSSSDEQPRQPNQKAEFIYRVHNEHHFPIEIPKLQKQTPYSWERGMNGNYPRITKEYFRCKGSSLNPVRSHLAKESLERFYDCGGSSKHSLPLRDGKEFIYPILIDLLNYIQTKTEKRVVITCGHRCPEHNSYSDPSISNQYSKHMIGAEVSFYVQGMEELSEKIIQLCQDFYKTNPDYSNKKEYTEFKVYEKEDTYVSTPPVYNKEIYIKLYKKKEGRDFDNRHPYPYISIQVRHDREKDERVIYSWKEANQNYLRK